MRTEGILYDVSMVIVDGLTTQGLDFLQRYKSNIDIGKLVLYIPDTRASVKLSTNAHCLLSDTTVAVRAVTNVAIPARCEQQILAKVDSVILDRTQTWLIEHSLPACSKLIVARALVSSGPDQSVVVSVMNPSNEPVTLSQGTVLARVQTINDEDNQMSIATIQSEDISPQKYKLLEEMVAVAGGLSKEQRNALFALVLSYEDIFAMDSSDLGYTTIVQHSINTGAPTTSTFTPTLS